jgi:hypothetical protein
LIFTRITEFRSLNARLLLRVDFFAPQQFTTATKGAYGWNQAIRSEVNASDIFAVDDKAAKPLRDLGFGSVLTHQKDGIARGTGAFVTLANEKEKFGNSKR